MTRMPLCIGWLIICLLHYTCALQPGYGIKADRVSQDSNSMNTR